MEGKQVNPRIRALGGGAQIAEADLGNQPGTKLTQTERNDEFLGASAARSSALNLNLTNK
jgi:hypothetical protein